MKYISLSSVKAAYKANASTTTNRFWGLIGILSALDSVVRPSVSYNFFSYKASEKLDSIFILSDDKGTGYRKDTIRSVIFAKDWVNQMEDSGLKKRNAKLNVYNVLVWYFRNRPFADDISIEDILKMFLEDINLSVETARQIFDFDKIDFTLEDSKYDESALQAALELKKKYITAENGTVEAKPGDFTRGPLLQPLYASQDIAKCLLLTTFDFSEVYLNQTEEEDVASDIRELIVGPIQAGIGKPGMPKFLEEVIRETLKADENLSLLESEITTSDKYLAVNGCRIGVELEHGKSLIEKEHHTHDANVDIKWTRADAVYCVYKELEKTGFDSFIAGYNRAYAGRFEIEKSQESGTTVFRLYRLQDQMLPTEQVIFYGAPGTGKSKDVADRVKNKEDFTFRVTFHPDTDYSSFVGSYKPRMKDGRITYEFVPQVFIKAYIKAWKNPKRNVFLVIEEINRGNCAQIFGDLFQLLDRDENMVSKYPIKADTDLIDYLKLPENLGTHNEGVTDDSLKLPGNLSILATMNTSDQSLFPMDSAFKRRWDWKFVKINYKDASKFILQVSDTCRYNWGEALQALNDYIKSTTGSTNKLIGNRFVQMGDEPIISYDRFRDKVLFYLFGDVYKDDDTFASDFFNGSEDYQYFEDLCERDNAQFTINFLNRLMKKEDTVGDESKDNNEGIQA